VLSRREFLGALAAPSVPVRGGGCRVVDPGPGCLLPESLAGFRSMGVPADSERARFHITPGAGALPDDLLRSLLESRGWILFESAAGFGGFDTQRRQLARHFGIEIGCPLVLGRERVPYIDYHWPTRVKIRDFDRVVPVAAAPHEVIASIGGRPVAARRGRFIFLGSPVGPALLAGDREAHRWFHALRRSAAQWAPLFVRS
jgi:hypothetical protein